MKNLVTISDYSYLLKGLTLYESISKKTKDFVLHYLCIDKNSFEHLKKFESETLKVYSSEELTKSDETLNLLSLTNYKYFCWCLASYFTNWLIGRINSPVCYVDSDIFFYKDLNLLYKEFGDCDVGIFRHRQFTLDKNYPEGWFNVGVVYFNNSERGKSILEWWADAVKFRKYPQLATCGDQKYLDEFPKLTNKILIDGNIGHGAPWQWHIYQFTDDGNIIWEGKEQELIFTHFSQFQDNGETYIPSTMHHIYTPLQSYKTNIHLKKLYDDYHYEIKKVKEKYIQNGSQR